MTDGLVIHNAIIDKMTFERWFNRGKGTSDYLTLAANNKVLVEIIEMNEEDGTTSYGEPYQGWTGEASMIFKVLDNGQPRFFKKLGTIDSYSGIAWDGKFSEVFPTEKTVTVYDYREYK